MQILDKLLVRLKYRTLLQEVLHSLARKGVRISPFYLYREPGIESGVLPSKPLNDGYETVFLHEEDMKAIATKAGRTLEKLLQRLRDGYLCFAVKCRGGVAAFTWCNVQNISFLNDKLLLKPDAAYLYDAYTFRAFRGNNIAPYMRHEFYREMAKLGKKEFYSISEIFNTSAIKFKKKLGAKPLELWLYVDLWKRWRFYKLLKQYKDSGLGGFKLPDRDG